MERIEHEAEQVALRALEDYYRAGRPPWDTEITPPELVAEAGGPGERPPGRALELGCGTGTNAIYLARLGWEVTAVDVIDIAIGRARAKAANAGLPVRLVHGDATRLPELGVTGPYDLFFDLSCYTGIPVHRRDAYAAGVTAAAAPGARMLMFGYGPGALDTEYPGIFPGVTADELSERFTGWELADVVPGTNAIPTYWFTLRYTGPA